MNLIIIASIEDVSSDIAVEEENIKTIRVDLVSEREANPLCLAIKKDLHPDYPPPQSAERGMFML